jgi:predicted dehydrogenase
MWEFISAIVEGRQAEPSFYDGLRAQLVADAVLTSHATARWVELPDEPR